MLILLVGSMQNVESQDGTPASEPQGSAAWLLPPYYEWIYNAATD